MKNAPTNFIRKIWRSIPLLILAFAAACMPAGALAAPATPFPTATLAPSPTPDPLAGSALVSEFAAGGNSYQILPVDLRTGQPVAGVQPIQVGSTSQSAFSNDRTRLAVVAGVAGCPGLCLTVIQLANPGQHASIQLTRWSDINNFAVQVLFDPQDRRIAVTYVEELKNKIAIIDASQPEPRLIRAADLALAPSQMAFTPDGSQIMLVGQVFPPNQTSMQINPTMQAHLLDAQTLNVKWSQDLPGVKDGMYGSGDLSKLQDNTWYAAGMSADPAAERIYIANADGEQLTTVDFKARAVKTVAIHAPESLLDRAFAWLLNLGVTPVQAKAANNHNRAALLSPDGRTLYVTGDDMNMVEQQNNGTSNTTPSTVWTSFGLEAWDLASGTKLMHLDTQASELHPLPDGKILLNGSDLNASDYHPFTEIFDPAAGKITLHAADTYAYTTLRLDGTPVLVSELSLNGENPKLSVLDEKTLEPLVTFKMASSYADWVIYR